MLRAPIDESEKLVAEARLERARDLMTEALSLLDTTPVATDCDAYLDQAIHNLRASIAHVKDGARIFQP